MKASDELWHEHEGFIFKVSQNDISGKLLNDLQSFVKMRKQRLVMNCEFSS